VKLGWVLIPFFYLPR